MIVFPVLGSAVRSETLTINTGAVFGLTALPGQMGLNIRYISGGSLEIGGASLSAGNGFLLPNSNIPHYYIPITDVLYMLATGSNAVVTLERMVSPGNPGSAG